MGPTHLFMLLWFNRSQSLKSTVIHLPPIDFTYREPRMLAQHMLAQRMLAQRIYASAGRPRGSPRPLFFVLFFV